jgi:hypothetical protein
MVERRRDRVERPPVLVVRCAWCGRRSTDEGWVAEETGDDEPDFISHGICEDCLKRLTNRGEPG